MALSYHFTFSAPASMEAEMLESILRKIEKKAQNMGFRPTMVLDANFDTPERREFARRVIPGVHLEDDRLAGPLPPKTEQVWNYDQKLRHCRLAPIKAIILVVTDEQGCETVFGFARFPSNLQEANGHVLMETAVGDRWYFHNFVDSPDKRYRQIVAMFMEEGFVEEEDDEYSEDSGYIYIPPSDAVAEENLEVIRKNSLEQLSKREFLKVYCSLAYLYPGFHPDDWESWEGPDELRPLFVEAWRRADANELKDNELYPYQAVKAAIIHGWRTNP